LVVSARSTRLRAIGGFSSSTVRARPTRAGTHSSSARNAAWKDFVASCLLYFSRNSSPHAVFINTSSGANDDASLR
jgi:hypothetical protein